MLKSAYRTIVKDGKKYTVFDKVQAIANIYEYNKALGARY